MRKEQSDSVKGSAAQAPHINWTCVDTTVFDISDNPLGPYTLTQGLAYDPEANWVFFFWVYHLACALSSRFFKGER